MRIDDDGNKWLTYDEWNMQRVDRILREGRIPKQKTEEKPPKPVFGKKAA